MDPGRAAARLLAEFGLPTDVVAVDEVGRAWSNQVWSVRTTRGHYAIKELLNPWGDPLWREWLAEASRFELRAVDAGVHSPRPLPTSAGDALVDLDGRTFRAHEWIDTSRPCPDGPVSKDIARAVARDLAIMHALHVAPTRQDVFPTPTTETCDAWPELVTELQRVGSPYAQDAERIVPEVATIREWFVRRPDGRRVMSHGDIDQKNLLLTDGTVWLVDWDVAAPWLPAEEAMRTAMSLASWTSPAIVDVFLSAYFREGGDAFEPGATLLAHDLRIGLDWLDRCLRVAAGLLSAEDHRVAEARQQVDADLRRLPERVATAADLPRPSTKPHESLRSHKFGP
ncbi:phosphotransferase [Flexivirga alba]|uniref:Phosphotransferase n=1 Tax=Flexivirga alba TaxID=702742 RepID=A0ABW2AMP4_9MICO